MKTPYFSLNKGIAIKQYEKIANLSDIVSYSSKTNSDVTKVLENETNCMFSVHAVNELKHIKDCTRVLFIAQGWDLELIHGLINKGITNFVVDNESDLNELLKYEHCEKLTLLLRLRLKENSIRTEKYYVFGMYSETIKERIDELKEKFNNVGIHFHRKSQNLSEWNLKFELENIFDETFLKKLDIINIGGGIPSIYANTNIDVFDSIFNKILDFKEWINSFEIKLMMEPGRFICAPAVKLVTKIISIHDDTIIVDASVYNGDLDALIVPVKLLVQGEFPIKGPNKSYIIKGVTPCSMDIFRYRVYLEEQFIGNKIIFENAGAYNFHSDFCDQEKLPTIIEDGPKISIKDAEVNILKVPFSGGGLGKGQGSNEAPEIITKHLENIFANEDARNCNFNIKEVEVDENNIQLSHDNIEKSILGKQIILGGDHSITYPAVKGFKKDCLLIVFDAHPDVMEEFKPSTQENYLRNLIEDGIVNPNNVILVGVRNWDKEEVQYLVEKGVACYTMKQIFEEGVRFTIEQILSKCDKPIYLSLDVDVVDPVEAIGTGYIEHGGLSSRELIYMLQRLKRTGKIEMIDLVEVNPKKDVNEITSILAAKILAEMVDF